ncbi:MAG TPA: outer membrane lipoprotein-sorting protein [Chthoniobacterales bacterium]|nr:outer membrane lipoprotein-sorting protein [Chthoniobacterales bacterium]
MLRLLPFFTLLLLPPAQAAPSAQEILATVRMQQARQEVDLEGQLREEGRIVPFHLTQTGAVIRYAFTNPAEALQLRLGDSDSRLEEITRDGVDKVSGPEFDQKVRGTSVTYADLALKFLYWPTGRVLGEDTIRTRRCWKLQLKAPSRAAGYSNVLLWVDQEGGALMRLEGYDWNAKLAKRFEVVSAQKIEGRWFLKQMRIEELQPETGKVRSRTYLEIKK